MYGNHFLMQKKSGNYIEHDEANAITRESGVLKDDCATWNQTTTWMETKFLKKKNQIK